jgi:O-antigen/teichoic acid export membrane protein
MASHGSPDDRDAAPEAPRPSPTIVAAAKRFVGHGYQTSIVRRTVILCCCVIPAFAANLLVHYFGAALLSPESFGVFYVANTLGNVLFSGSLILSTLYTRHLVKVAAEAGEDAALARWLGLERAMITWGALAAAGTFVVLVLIGHAIGMRSWMIASLVIVDTYAAYVADFGRTLLQSLRRTLLLGLYTLAWMLARLGFCVAGILAFDTAGGALLGSVGAALAVILGFHLWFARAMPTRGVAVPGLASLLPLLPLTLGYGILIALSNLDVLASFFLLDESDRGIYSASSVFPKAILVVTMPVLQLLFALMTAQHVMGQAFRRAAGKSSAIVFGLAVMGSAAVWLSAPWSCGDRWGLSLCDRATLEVLLLSVVPLSLLRVLVLLQIARGRDRQVLFLALPVALYLWIAWNSPRGIGVMAEQFSIFSVLCLGLFSCFCVGAEVLLRRRARRHTTASGQRVLSRRSFVRQR